MTGTGGSPRRVEVRVHGRLGSDLRGLLADLTIHTVPRHTVIRSSAVGGDDLSLVLDALDRAGVEVERIVGGDPPPSRARGNSVGDGAVGVHMTATADTVTPDATITALRAVHDELAAVVAGLTDEQLLARSGADEWSVAQVLSHLGSGAEIGLATLRAATGEGDTPGDGFNQSVWDRWNALPPRAQAEGFLVADAALVAAYEALTPEQRDGLHVDLGFLPAPLPLVSFAGMRLNEAAQHSWDVRVALDEQAAIDEAAAALVVAHFASGLGFLLGFTARADEVNEPALVTLGGLGTALSITESVTLVPVSGDSEPTAVLVGPADAVARLLSGRLAPTRTPAGVSVSGNVGLDELRRVFPGY